MARQRRGMLIKNLTERPLAIRMATRRLDLEPGEERPVTAEEVRDSVLREHLQIRTIAVVRPITPEENEQLERALAEGE